MSVILFTLFAHLHPPKGTPPCELP